MNRSTIKGFLALVALSLAAASPIAHADQLCVEGGGAGYKVLFFNGVQNTPVQAAANLTALKSISTTINEDGLPITYDVAYNQTSGLNDFLETFQQRAREQAPEIENRLEFYWELVRFGGAGPAWNALIQRNRSLSAVMESLRDEFLDYIADRTALDVTSIDYSRHQALIQRSAIGGEAIAMVAHSQGNLFMVRAFNYAAQRMPASALRALHVAPASTVAVGGHFLADLDLVINGLRLSGQPVLSVTHPIPNPFNRPPGWNGKKDFLGHGFLEIYLNQDLALGVAVRERYLQILAELLPPQQTAAQGFFTATLTWDGPGDVDLHVYEPNGTKVYWSRKRGSAGELDVDNTVGEGPEHYYASCLSNQLLPGVYRVGVANYSRATSRTATVQISTANAGVLGSRSVVLGSPTGSTTGFDLFNVLVTNTGQTWSAQIQ